MSDDSDLAALIGGILASLALPGLVICLAVGDCNKKKQNQEQKQSIESIVQEEKETVLTQITEIQPRMIPYESNGKERIAVYNYVHISGGDVKEAKLILPSESIENLKKYTPVRVTFTKVKYSIITLQEIVAKYYDKNGISTKPEIIKADGIIEPDGVKYLGDEK